MADDTDSVAMRRERRRQKILNTSEDRMKRIFDNSGSSEHRTTPCEDEQYVGTRQQHTSEEVTESIPYDSFNSMPTKELDCSVVHKPDDRLQNHNDVHLVKPSTEDSSLNKKITEERKLKKQEKVKLFVKIRTILLLVAGILVRLSFEFSFGADYVQTIFNPFMALEISIIGYQSGVGMEFGENVKGGIWLSTLVLMGMKVEVIHTYKSIMGIVTAIATDFAVFCFSFIILHLVL